MVQDPRTKRWKEKGEVLAVRNNYRSYVVYINGKEFLCNRKFLKPVYFEENQSVLMEAARPPETREDKPKTEKQQQERRSPREQRKPKFY